MSDESAGVAEEGAGDEQAQTQPANEDEEEELENEENKHEISLDDINQDDIKDRLDKLFSALQTSGWARIGQLNLEEADSIMDFIALNINNESKYLQDIAKSLVRLAFELPYMHQPNATYPFFKKIASMSGCSAVQPLLEYMTAVVCQLYDVAKKFDGKKKSDETKPTSLLVRAMADVCPQLIYPYLTRFLRFLNHEQPAIRVSTLYAINAILRCQDMSTERIKHFPRKKKTKDDLLDRIRDAMNDESSLVRVMAIKTLSDLSKDNLIPKAHFRMGLISEIGSHLREDKISVRRAAGHYLSQFLEVNTYGHDFDYELHKKELLETLEQKKKLLAKNPENHMVSAAVEQFSKVEKQIEEHILHYVKKFRKKRVPAVEGDPENVYGAVIHHVVKSTKESVCIFVRLAFDGLFQFLNITDDKSDEELTKELFDILKEEFVNVKTAEFMANEKDVLNNEQNVEDYENKIKQINKKIVAIRDMLIVGLELEHCLPPALTCIFNGETSEVKELIKFIAECKQFNIKGSDHAVRSMCSLIWKNSEELRQAVLDAAVLMFCSTNQHEDIRDEATTNNLIAVMCDITNADRGCVEEVIRRISSEHIREGVIDRFWLIVKDKRNEIPLAQKIAAMRLISVRAMSSDDKQRLRGRLRSFQQIIRESHPMVAVEALKGIANLAEEYDSSSLDSIKKTILRIPQTDSLFQTIEKFFFKEILREPMLEKTGKSGQDYWFYVVQNTLDIIFNIAKDTNALLARITARLFIYLKRISEAYTFYAKQLEEMEGGLVEEGAEIQESDDPKVEIVRERKLYWSLMWIRISERVMAFAGEVATRAVVHVGHSFMRSARALVSLLSSTFSGKMKARAINDGKDELDALEYASAKGQYFLGFQKSNEEGVGGMGDEERLNERTKCIDQRLLEDNALLGRLFQLVIFGLRAEDMPRVVRNAAAVAFGKFMLISPVISNKGTYLFTALMTNYPVDLVRHNLLVNCVDFYSRQSNSISQYKQDLYSL
ncbi:hypothetical protein WR25_05672 [Diploscapter pachys]|uniref:Uncharacterized protein n=1 Tax=Diploscapter pachys TaxID=2018661 RepID=A0A2A2LHU4_9BILA|nr:hypothetical protein WR25_05672 [Diploscapter pachys]